MKIETLKKSHLKKNIIIGVVVVAMISAVILNFTRAKYRVTESIPLVNGIINYSLADFNAVAIYVNGDSGYTKTDTIPDGYVLNESESYCTVNGEEDTSISLSYDTATKSLSVTPMTTKGTKCYLYFDEKGITNIQELIASKNLATRTDFSTTLKEDTTGTIYQAQDDDGTTYYFAGNTNDNWVLWAGFYWRIIRINGDGTIRIIYQGIADSETPDNGNITGTETQIGTSTFNSTSTDNMYVGYKYESNQVHGLQDDSTIKVVLDEWYQENLSSYADDIDENAGFCGDRTSTTTNGGAPNDTGGTGKTKTYYGARYRLDTNKTPTFECPDEGNDLYTTSGSSQGNKALQYPIGLITADEVAYAGGVWFIPNTSYYLYTGQDYWTMSPSWYSNGWAFVFFVSSTGLLDNTSVNVGYGVRPVINLKSNVQFSEGNGTSDKPFVVS